MHREIQTTTNSRSASHNFEKIDTLKADFNLKIAEEDLAQKKVEFVLSNNTDSEFRVKEEEK